MLAVRGSATNHHQQQAAQMYQEGCKGAPSVNMGLNCCVHVSCWFQKMLEQMHQHITFSGSA